MFTDIVRAFCNYAQFILGHNPGNCTIIALRSRRDSLPFHILSILCSPTGKTTNHHWGRRLTPSNIGFLGAFAFCSKWKRMSWETVKDLSNKLQNMEYCVKSIMEFNLYWCYISCYELFHCGITSIIFNVTHSQTTFKILIDIKNLVWLTWRKVVCRWIWRLSKMTSWKTEDWAPSSQFKWLNTLIND